MQWMLPAHPPFSLRAVALSHGWVRLAPFSFEGDVEPLVYVDRLPSGRVVEVEIGEIEDGVRVQVTDDLASHEQAHVAERVSWMLGLGQDLAAFYALAQEEPQLAHVEQAAQGRVLRCPTLFEDTVKTILTTNTAWGGTKRMVRNLVAHYGDPLAADPQRRAFPTAQQLATVGADRLRSDGGLGYRAPYVAELALAVAEQRLDLEALKQSDLPTSELRKRLLAIKGVGSYAAANLLIILGRYDYLPVDSWALMMVSREWHDGQPVGPAEVEAAFDRWGPWKGLAYFCWNWSHEAD